MNQNRFVRRCLVALVVTAWPALGYAALVNVGTITVTAEVTDNTKNVVVNTSGSYNNTISASDDAGNSSSNTANVNGNSFAFTFAQTAAGNNDVDFGYAYGFVEFTPITDVHYSASGAYSFYLDQGALLTGQGKVRLNSELNNIPANGGTSIFRSTQNGGGNLGGGNNNGYTTDVNLNNNSVSSPLTGSLTGTLLHGVTYNFLAVVTLSGTYTGDNAPDPLAKETGSGNVQIIFSPVPEPNSALVLSAAFSLLIRRRRRIRK